MQIVTNLQSKRLSYSNLLLALLEVFIGRGTTLFQGPRGKLSKSIGNVTPSPQRNLMMTVVLSTHPSQVDSQRREAYRAVYMSFRIM